MKKIIAWLMAVLMVTGVFGIFTGCETWQEPGEVRYLNCVPEANEAWQKLAVAYSDIYGVEVTVRTVTADDCAAAVATELSGENAPTAFQFHSTGEFAVLEDCCMDLTGTALLSQIVTQDMTLTRGNAVKAMGYSYEAGGIIVNTALLTQAGYTLEDIQSRDGLKAVAEDIHQRAQELGFDAFASAGLDASSAWRFSEDLANLSVHFEQQNQTVEAGTYLELYRQMIDLYIDNAAADRVTLLGISAEMSVEEFGTGKAVFMQHSASVYSALVGDAYAMDPRNLTLLPVCFDVEDEEHTAVCCTVSGYWAVNTAASEADRNATLAFLNWVATSEYGISVLSEQFGGVPFKAAANSGNVLYANAHDLIAEGKFAVTGTSGDKQLRDALTYALVLYAADRCEENWEVVRAALADIRSQ